MFIHKRILRYSRSRKYWGVSPFELLSRNAGMSNQTFEKRISQSVIDFQPRPLQCFRLRIKHESASLYFWAKPKQCLLIKESWDTVEVENIGVCHHLNSSAEMQGCQIRRSKREYHKVLSIFSPDRYSVSDCVLNMRAPHYIFEQNQSNVYS